MPRKIRKKYHYLYKTTNVITKEFYIGVHSTYDMPNNYLGSGTKLWRRIKKYGRKNFVKEILYFFKNAKEKFKKEREIVNEKMLQDSLCMNVRRGGIGGFYSEKHKKKWILNGQIASAKKCKNTVVVKIENKFVRINKEDYQKGKFDTIWTNRKHNEKTKKKIGKANSKYQSGKNNSQFGTCWIYNIELKENKKIDKNEIDKWLNENWKKGRKMNL